MTGRRSGVPAELMAGLDQLTGVFDELEGLAGQFADLVRRCQENATDPHRDDLARLRPTIHDILDRHRGWLAGAGVIVAPNLLADAPRWLEWWFTRPSGTPEALRVSLDESAVDFYDYTSAEWYALPARTGRRHAAGPYVDYLCTNEYSLTLSAPVRLGRQLLGMVGADVLAASLESRFAPVLAALGDDLVLANAAGRVIASATPRYAPGHRIALDAAEAVPLPTRAATQGTQGWLLLRAGSA